MFLQIIQIFLAILLIISVLIQHRGTGLGSAFGSGGGESFYTRRGAEKIVFFATIILGILFLGVSFVSFLIS